MAFEKPLAYLVALDDRSISLNARMIVDYRPVRVSFVAKSISNMCSPFIKGRASRSGFLRPAVLTTLLTIAAANAEACGDRPGTPNNVSVKVYDFSTIRFNWNDTTKPGEEGALGPYYDIEVVDQALRPLPLSSTGENRLFGGKVFSHLEPEKTYCFRVRGRTASGTGGCVSLRWSARVCYTTPVPPIYVPPKP